MEMKHTQNRLECLRAACGEETAKYFEIPQNQFDPSALLVAQCDEKGQVLFMPAMNRWRWFKLDHPDAVVVPRDPVFVSRVVTVAVDVYLSIDDKLAQRVFCSGACSSLLTDDVHLVNSLRTRAIGNAMRNAGYDIPMSAHFIEGWTEVRGAADPVPEEAMESGVRIIPIVPPAQSEEETLQAADESTLTLSVPAQQETSSEKVDSTASAAPSKGKKASTRKKKEPESKENEPEPKENEPELNEVQSDAPATVNNQPDTSVPNEEASEEPVVEASQPAEETEKVEVKQEESVSDTGSAQDKPAVYARADVAQMLQEAREVFGGVVGAEGFTHPVFWNTGVGEQSDMRVGYFAKKGIAGELPDKKLALATLLVAYERGLKI